LVGTFTSQDEYGTAAYKTVELDDYLGGLPVQYREVQGNESAAFLHLFDKLVIQHGGIESGFKHVEPEKYRPRLLHVKGTIQKTVVREVDLHHKALNSGDVFILDQGLKVFQFQGKSASGGEKSKAAQLARGIDDERGSKVQIAVLDESDEDKAQGKEKEEWNAFWTLLGGKAPISPNDPDSDKAVKPLKQLFKVSDASGQLQFTEVPFKKASLDENDAFVVSTGPQVYVWVGKNATAQEKKTILHFCAKIPQRSQRTLQKHPHHSCFVWR